MNAVLDLQESSTAERARPDPGSLVIDLKQHSVCMVIPHGTIITGDLDVPGGALILGSVRGRIRCREGSLILGEGSEFAGKAEAAQIYVAGVVRALKKGEISELHGAALVAVSRCASGRAKLRSRTFSIHSRTFGGQLEALE
jgi:hypothetical protein